MAGDALHLSDAVAGEENGPAGAGQIDHAGEEFAPNEQIEAGGRLVEDQHFRVEGEGQGEADLGVTPLGEIFQAGGRV